MKKKIVVLFILSLFLCGCDVKYDLSIHNGKVSEIVSIPYDVKQRDAYAKDFYYDIDSMKKYGTEIKKDRFILTNKKVLFENISSNFYFQNCFDNIDSFEDKEYYNLGTSEGFKCMYYEQEDIDEIVITLNTFNKVTEHNADETKFGKYIWYFDKYNYKNKRIYFSVKKNDYLWYYRLRGLFIGLGSVLVIVGIGTIIIKVFKNRSNKENRI